MQILATIIAVAIAIGVALPATKYLYGGENQPTKADRAIPYVICWVVYFIVGPVLSALMS